MTSGEPLRIAWLRADDPPAAFPDPATACREPDGLLAAGGDLSEARLLHAYRHGIFPWYSEGEPILWWSPDPRCMLEPGALHVSRRFARWLARCPWSVTFNRRFAAVIDGCAGARRGQRGTWITGEMRAAYANLHAAGWAHSVEVQDGERLVGGIYGLAIGRAFFGESMFSAATNASKVALLALCRELVVRDFALLDCQVESPHLLTLGATSVPRSDFLERLAEACAVPGMTTDWPAESLPAAGLAGRP